jgi:hypothetical protein
MVGMIDYLASDSSCSAMLQGRTHLTKIYNWVNFVVPYLTGGTSPNLPSTATVDYVDNVGHNAWLIVNSDPGIQRLFLDDYNGPGKNAAAPASNGECFM